MSCQTQVLVQGASEVTKGVRTCLNRHLTSMGGSRCAMRMSMLLRNTHTSCSQAGRPPAGMFKIIKVGKQVGDCERW